MQAGTGPGVLEDGEEVVDGGRPCRPGDEDATVTRWQIGATGGAGSVAIIEKAHFFESSTAISFMNYLPIRILRGT